MDADIQTLVDANRRNWEARTPVHMASRFYDVHNAEADRLAPFEWAELGDVAGLRIAHLQCHLGTDTRCLARAGARMTGLDFSDAAVEAARELAGDLDISYVRADVHDAVSVTYQWNHALGTVVTALNRAGLRVTELHEHPVLAWDQWAGLERDEASGWWRLPAHRPRIPLTYSLTAIR